MLLEVVQLRSREDTSIWVATLLTWRHSYLVYLAPEVFGMSGAFRRPRPLRWPKRQLRSSLAAMLLLRCTGDASRIWFSWDLVIRRRLRPLSTIEIYWRHFVLMLWAHIYVGWHCHWPLTFLLRFFRAELLLRLPDLSATVSGASPSISLASSYVSLRRQCTQLI